MLTLLRHVLALIHRLQLVYRLLAKVVNYKNGKIQYSSVSS
jgi:hypothetical protein